MSKDDKEGRVEEAFYTKMGVEVTGIGAAIKVIELNATTHTCVCLNGESGIGKTHIVRQVAAAREVTKDFVHRGKQYRAGDKGVPLEVLMLPHLQPEDVGVPFPARAARTALLQEADLLLRLLERESEESPQGTKLKRKLDTVTERILTNGFSEADHFDFLLSKTFAELPPEGILFLDEWNRAQKATVAAFFSIVEDRQVHGHPLPEGLQIVAAMNPSDGAYMVNEAEKDHAIRKRLSFVAVTTSLGTWLEYAGGKGAFHMQVVDFVRAMPAMLYDTKLRNAGKVFPCPATWEKVSTVLKAAEKAKIDLTADPVKITVAGHIGSDAAEKLVEFIRNNQIVINPEDILHNYGEKSKTRKRVLALVAANRNDVLGELCHGVSATLFSSKPDPEKIAPHLALYMGDLAPELAVSMVVNRFGTDSDSAERGQDYLVQLSRALHTQPAHTRLFEDIAVAMRKAKEQLGDGALLDPTA